MFSKNAYLQGCPASCLSGSLTSVADLNDHYHHDMFSGPYIAANAPVAVDAAAFFNQDVLCRLNGNPSGLCPKTAKKDRHSKICTAQGPRDRRVRLSIGVARKFFDLQETLGFDKPSKTLDWLLTKSKTAINDLQVQTKENASTGGGGGGGGAKSFVNSSISECEVDSGEASENGKFLVTDSKRKLGEKNKGAAKGCKKDSIDVAKESRVKARARARERTREKMCIKEQLNETRNNINYVYDLNSTIPPIQYMNNQLEVCKISGCNTNINNNNNSSASIYKANPHDTMLHCPQTYGTGNQDLIQESIFIKRKVKQHPSFLGFQQNHRDLTSNYAIPSPYNASENWDICSILNQHAFINRTSNN